jgi:hypothetical protein
MDEQILVLREISGKMGLVDTIGSWADVQAVVRRGLANKYFAVGDQLVATYNGTPYVFNVIGINHDVPSTAGMTHSMTIQTVDCLINAMIDAPEPNNPDANRKLYGNNRYIHSAIRQWLNSAATTFAWVSQHADDVAPTSAPYTGPGYLKLLDPELVAVLGPVTKQVAKATVDGGGQDIFADRVFLLSRKEIYGTDEGVITGEAVYPFYSKLNVAATDSALAGRIKLLGASTRNWWLRSPSVSSSYSTRSVSTDGSVHSHSSNLAGGLAPACAII